MSDLRLLRPICEPILGPVCAPDMRVGEQNDGRPAIFRGALWHDFRTGRLPDGYTYSCNSVVRRWSPQQGQYIEVAANVFVPDYRTSNGENLGFLSEPTATNLVLYSSENNAAWVGTNASKAAGTSSLIAGKTCFSIAQTDAAGYVVQTIGTYAGSGTETATAIIEQGANAVASRVVMWNATDGAAVAIAEVNWSAETASLISGTGAVYVEWHPTGPNGGKVCRLGIAGYTSPAGSKARELRILPDATASNAVIYMHHAQLEAGTTRVSTPIVTLGASVNRAATILSISPLPAWFDQAQYTMFSDVFVRQVQDAFQAHLVLSDGTAAKLASLRFSGTGQAQVLVNDTTAQATISVGSGLSGHQTLAASVKANEFRFACNGTAGSEDTSGSLPEVSKINVGSSGAGSLQPNVHIKRFGIAPVTQTSAQLQALTA